MYSLRSQLQQRPDTWILKPTAVIEFFRSSTSGPELHNKRTNLENYGAALVFYALLYIFSSGNGKKSSVYRPLFGYRKISQSVWKDLWEPFSTSMSEFSTDKKLLRRNYREKRVKNVTLIILILFIRLELARYVKYDSMPLKRSYLPYVLKNSSSILNPR